MDAYLRPGAHEMLSCSIAHRGTTTVLAPEGEIDVATATSCLAPALGRAFAASPETLVVDLGGVTFLDTCGVHVLQDAHRRARATDVRLVILPAPGAAQRIFGHLGLADVLPLAARYGRLEHDDVDALDRRDRFQKLGGARALP